MFELLEQLTENIFSVDNYNLGIHKTDHGEYICYSIDIPGVLEKDINVTLTGNVVEVNATRHIGKSSQTINKQFTISKGCDLTKLKADLSDGVLKLSLPYKELPKQQEVRRIPLNTTNK